MACVRRLGLALAWLALSTSTARAQQASLQLDLHQGLEFGAARPRTPYLFEADVAPGIQLGRFQIAALAAPSYDNPHWDVGLGARCAWLLPIALDDGGLRLTAQGAYLPRRQGLRVSFGFVIEAFGLLRLGVWPGYDVRARRALLTTSIGLDFVSWLRLARLAGEGG